MTVLDLYPVPPPPEDFVLQLWTSKGLEGFHI